eukprot:TRINITY_DN1546_c0_g1_i4.p1 TRINITY_DN1546_c0_g1~~TRINITY_DN1546_c0_g1_i4.p1  ORF type:complete len:375 (+),score=95.05 TRINITY_DN1546_c0_g1_i4:767-1891(+)
MCSVYQPCAVAKSDVGNMPVVGVMARAIQTIFVDRLDHNSRKLAMETISVRTDLATSGKPVPQVLIFPEGTTTNGNMIINFKTGAFRQGVPVQPVVLKYPNKYRNCAHTLDNQNMGKTFLGLMCQFGNYMEVQFLEPYIPSEEEIQNEHLYAENVRTLMADALGVPSTEHSYEDMLLMKRALSLQVPVETANIELERVREIINVDLDEAKELLSKFADINPYGDGNVTVEEFASYLLGIPPSPEVLELFNRFDTNEDGTINFREFLVGLIVFTKETNINKQDLIERCFHLFDENDNGTITRSEFKTIMMKVFPAIQKPEVNRIFSEMDSNRDGLVSFIEFEEYSMTHPEYMLLANEVLGIPNDDIDTQDISNQQ